MADLVAMHMYIDGAWCDAADGRTLGAGFNDHNAGVKLPRDKSFGLWKLVDLGDGADVD